MIDVVSAKPQPVSQKGNRVSFNGRLIGKLPDDLKVYEKTLKQAFDTSELKHIPTDTQFSIVDDKKGKKLRLDFEIIPELFRANSVSHKPLKAMKANEIVGMFNQASVNVQRSIAKFKNKLSEGKDIASLKN